MSLCLGNQNVKSLKLGSFEIQEASDHAITLNLFNWPMQWGKLLVIVMGFVDTLGQYIYVCTHLSNKFTVKKFQAAQLTHIKDF